MTREECKKNKNLADQVAVYSSEEQPAQNSYGSQWNWIYLKLVTFSNKKEFI